MEIVLVDHRRHAALVGDLGGHAVRRDDLVDQLADEVSASAQATASSIRTVPATGRRAG